jgi:hypothetical protein
MTRIYELRLNMMANSRNDAYAPFHAIYFAEVEPEEQTVDDGPNKQQQREFHGQYQR